MATSKSSSGFARSVATRNAKRMTSCYFAAAMLFILSGLFAITEPVFAGLGVTLLAGWPLIFGGILQELGADSKQFGQTFTPI